MIYEWLKQPISEIRFLERNDISVKCLVSLRSFPSSDRTLSRYGLYWVQYLQPGPMTDILGHVLLFLPILTYSGNSITMYIYFTSLL